jgi:pseudoazurin
MGIAAAMASLAIISPTWAADHQVKMVNKDSEGRAMQFEPAFLKIAPGDTVTFVATDKGHNSEALPNLIPEGAEPWKGKIGEEITVTFDVEGFYGYRCAPHFGLGMVGLIQVGDAATPPDISAVKLPGKAKDRMTELVSEASAAPVAN